LQRSDIPRLVELANSDGFIPTCTSNILSINIPPNICQSFGVKVDVFNHFLIISTDSLTRNFMTFTVCEKRTTPTVLRIFEDSRIQYPMSPLTDTQILGIFIAGDVLFTLLACVIGRHFVPEVVVNGKVVMENLPSVNNENSVNLQPVIDGDLFDFGLCNTMDTIISSFAFAMTYGCIAVISCNWAFAEAVDKRVGWLLCVYCIYFSLCFMCAFSENAIHIVTPHAIHMVYYGFGYIPLALYYELPFKAWLPVVAVLARLILNTVMKYYVWPNYPWIP